MCSISTTFVKKADIEDMIDQRDRPTVYGFGGTDRKAGMIYLCSCFFKITSKNI